MKEIPPPAPLVFTPSKIQEDTEVELLEKSKDAEESGTESVASESDEPEAVETVDGIDLEAVKERIQSLESLLKILGP